MDRVLSSVFFVEMTNCYICPYFYGQLIVFNPSCLMSHMAQYDFFLNLSSKNQFKAITYECTWLWDSYSLIFDKSCMCQNSLKYANFERLQEDLKGTSINDGFRLGERSSQVKGLFMEERKRTPRG